MTYLMINWKTSGKFNITGFYAETFGTFYQSCGNCLNQAKRNVTIQNVIAINGTRMGIVSFVTFIFRE